MTKEPVHSTSNSSVTKSSIWVWWRAWEWDVLALPTENSTSSSFSVTSACAPKHGLPTTDQPKRAFKCWSNRWAIARTIIGWASKGNNVLNDSCSTGLIPYTRCSTKIFVKFPKTLFDTEDAFQLKKNYVAAILQSKWKAILQRRKFLEMREAAIVLQKNARRWLSIQSAKRRAKAVATLRKYVFHYTMLCETVCFDSGLNLDYYHCNQGTSMGSSRETVRPTRITRRSASWRKWTGSTNWRKRFPRAFSTRIGHRVLKFARRYDFLIFQHLRRFLFLFYFNSISWLFQIQFHSSRE